MIADPNNPFFLIPATLAANPGLVVCLPVFAPAIPDHSLVLSVKRRLRPIPPELAAQLAQQEARSNGGGDKGPIVPPSHIEVGRLLLTIPADMADNLRGPVEERHPVYLISVHRDAYEEAKRQSESGIILPSSGKVVPGSVIVKP